MIRMDYISNNTKHTNKLKSTKPKTDTGEQGFPKDGQ